MTNIYDIQDHTGNLPAVNFQAPLVNPSPNGLYPVTVFDDLGEDDPVRFLGEGVRIWPHNYGGASAFGVWAATWCVDPDDKKQGTRVGPHAPFDPITVWAYDECDMTPQSEQDVLERVRQNLRLLEQTAVETEFAARMLTDAGSPTTGNSDIVGALGELEGILAETNTTGFIHASAALAATAAYHQLIIRTGTGLKTPLGNTWVFGGGYVSGLGKTLVATSPTFGWRNPVSVYSTVKVEWNEYVAVAERTVSIGYEACLAATTITP